MPWKDGWRVLDVGCGAGRHARALSAAGAHPIGLDLSAALLHQARTAGVPLVRADMRRLPVRGESIDFAVNLFTSFGYFEHDEEHAAVLRGIRDTLVPDGWFAIDFLNAATVRAGLVPAEEQMLGGQRVQVTRTIDKGGRRVIKTITIPGGRHFVERVRLLGPDDLEAMLHAAGMRVTARYGDYDGGPLVAGAPRAILIAQRVA